MIFRTDHLRGPELEVGIRAPVADLAVDLHRPEARADNRAVSVTTSFVGWISIKGMTDDPKFMYLNLRNSIYIVSMLSMFVSRNV